MFTTPTLVRNLPGPILTLIGTLAETQRVMTLIATGDTDGATVIV